jgi:hypothetical protein
MRVREQAAESMRDGKMDSSLQKYFDEFALLARDGR